MSATPDEIVPLRSIIVNLFSAQSTLVGLFKAAEKILTAEREGKSAFFVFNYPELGSVQYNNRTIRYLTRLAGTKSVAELAFAHLSQDFSTENRIHAIAALLLKLNGPIMNLYAGAHRCRQSTHGVVVTAFHNPFQGLFRTDADSMTLQRKDILFMQDVGNMRKPTPFLPMFLVDKLRAASASAPASAPAEQTAADDVKKKKRQPRVVFEIGTATDTVSMHSEREANDVINSSNSDTFLSDCLAELDQKQKPAATQQRQQDVKPTSAFTRSVNVVRAIDLVRPPQA